MSSQDIHIVADSKIPFLRGLLEPYAQVSYYEPNEITNSVVRDADILLVSTRTRVDKRLLNGSRCRFVGTATIGYDHIDTQYCDENGIRWQNAPGCNAISVGQYILASILLWARSKNRNIPELTIGIIGVGHVGSVVEKYCRAMGMKILLNDPPRAAVEGEKNFVSLDEIAAKADIITFHTPLTMQGEYATCHLGSAAFFDSLQRSPLIINSARGAVVDNYALLRALNTEKVCDAVMDCWEGEPRLNTALLFASYIATPHIAGYSADGKANASRMIIDAVAKELNITVDTSNIIPPSPPVNTLSLARNSDPIATAVLSSYNPLFETRNLKRQPHDFEKLRNTYGIRREFSAYNITGVVGNNATVLRELGFNL
jgi:erythronate-4-phosphate dehydrogenase